MQGPTNRQMGPILKLGCRDPWITKSVRILNRDPWTAKSVCIFLKRDAGIHGPYFIVFQLWPHLGKWLAFTGSDPLRNDDVIEFSHVFPFTLKNRNNYSGMANRDWKLTQENFLVVWCITIVWCGRIWTNPICVLITSTIGFPTIRVLTAGSNLTSR